MTELTYHDLLEACRKQNGVDNLVLYSNHCEMAQMLANDKLSAEAKELRRHQKLSREKKEKKLHDQDYRKLKAAYDGKFAP